jgi:hypothetical protein
MDDESMLESIYDEAASSDFAPTKAVSSSQSDVSLFLLTTIALRNLKLRPKKQQQPQKRKKLLAQPKPKRL